MKKYSFEFFLLFLWLCQKKNLFIALNSHLNTHTQQPALPKEKSSKHHKIRHNTVSRTVDNIKQHIIEFWLSIIRINFHWSIESHGLMMNEWMDEENFSKRGRKYVHTHTHIAMKWEEIFFFNWQRKDVMQKNIFFSSCSLVDEEKNNNKNWWQSVVVCQNKKKVFFLCVCEEVFLFYFWGFYLVER